MPANLVSIAALRSSNQRHAKNDCWRHGVRRPPRSMKPYTAQRTLRTVLASDTMSDEDREAILGVLYDTAAAHRDGHLLSDAEGTLIRQYLEIGVAGKQMLRTVCARLAATSDKAVCDAD
jgi:hypothetical protein